MHTISVLLILCCVFCCLLQGRRIKPQRKLIVISMSKYLLALIVGPRGVLSCSFIIADFSINSNVLTKANHYAKLRGPDSTNELHIDGWHFVHNLLAMTGSPCPQPFLSTGNEKVAAVYNGEIYNHRELASELSIPNHDGLGREASDGHILLPAYERWGHSFVRRLDGEFALALVDLRRGLLVLATDAFGTKPLWHAQWRDSLHGRLRFAIASYESSLTALGAPMGTRRLLEPNMFATLGFTPDAGIFPHTLSGQQASPVVFSRSATVEWDLRQHKNHTRDWEKAFLRAVDVRATSADERHRIFVGLSSGYDSGAVMLALLILCRELMAYSLRSKEDMSVIDQRISYPVRCAGLEAVKAWPDTNSFNEQRVWLRNHAEPFRSKHYRRGGGEVPHDGAAVGLSLLLARAHAQGARIYMSGSGADETISDYAMFGHRIHSHSCFEGVFPTNLSRLFPWCSFYSGTQRAYIMKEELTGGAHGMEVRYPFLDRRVVQEFLWLDSIHIKNSEYKRPIADFLGKHRFPNLYATKLGFSAEVDLHENGTLEEVVLPKIVAAS